MTATLTLHTYEEDNRIFTFDLTKSYEWDDLRGWLNLLLEVDTSFELSVKE